MKPQIKVQHNAGNTVTIQNDIATKALSYLSRDFFTTATTAFVENTNDFTPIITTGWTSGTITSTGTQLWTVPSTVGFNIGDLIITTGASTQAHAVVTGVGSSILTVDVAITGTGTPTGVTTAKGFLLVSEVGAENAELIQISSVNTTNPQSIALVSSPQLQHTRGEVVKEVVYDKVAIYKNNILIKTLSLQVSSQTTVFQDYTGLSTDQYKVQMYFSGWGNESQNKSTDYSETASADSFTSNTVGNLLSSVRSLGGISEDDKDITDQFLINALQSARDIMDTELKFGLQHEWRMEFEKPIQMLAGRNYVPLPADIDFTTSDRSVINVRIPSLFGSSVPLKYVDKRAWNSLNFTSRVTETVGSTSIAATTITLTTVGDLTDTGTLYISTNAANEQILAINYTGRNLVTNQLTGVTGITRTIPAGTQVYQRPFQAYPYHYTIFEGKMYLDCTIPQTMQGVNIVLDYIKEMTPLTQTTDTIPEKFRTAYKHYLLFAIKRKRDDSIGEDDADYKLFYKGLSGMLSNFRNGQSIRITR